MEKNLFTFNFKLIPKGGVLFLVYVFLFETFIYFIPPYILLKPPYSGTYLSQKEKISNKKNDFDLIIFGDCTSWAGIKPVILNKELSISSYNFSIDERQSYLISYLFLKRYLKNCLKKPKIVILSVSANSLLGKHKLDFETLNKYVLPYFSVRLDLLNELDNHTRFKLILYQCSCFFPSIKKQFFLKRGCSNLFHHWTDSEVYNVFLSYFEKEKGFYNENLDPGKKYVETITDIRESYKTFALSEHNIFYLEKMLLLLSKQNIRVIVCTNSIRSDEMKIWNEYNVKQNLFEFLQLKLKDYKNLVAFWDMFNVVSSKDNFIDHLHLNNDGAIIYTNELATRLKLFI